MSHSFQAAKVAVVEGRDVFQKLKPNAEVTAFHGVDYCTKGEMGGNESVTIIKTDPPTKMTK